MSLVLRVHPVDPQLRLLEQAVEIIKRGGVIVVPTDSTYALACHLGDKKAVERIRQIRQIGEEHLMTLVCRDLSELGRFAKVGNQTFRLMKRFIPGPYTFILKATKEVPNRLQHEKRKTIGLRVPDNKVLQSLLTILGEPLLSTSLILPNEKEALLDPEEMIERVSKQVDCIIDGGWLGTEVSTVIDLHEDTPVLVRAGKGAVDF